MLWMGPVQKHDLTRVFTPPEGWTVYTVGSQVARGEAAARPSLGVVPEDFRVWARAHLGSDPLGELLRLAGGAERAVLASYSAGHGLAEFLLAEGAEDARLRAAVLADSYYGLDVHAGSYAFGEAAIRDGRPFWLTTSNSFQLPHTPNSGARSVAGLADALGLGPVAMPAGMPPEGVARGRGSVLWMDYGGSYTHQGHVPFAGRMLASLAREEAGSWASATPAGGTETRGSSQGAGALLVGGLLTALLLLRRTRR